MAHTPPAPAAGESRLSRQLGLWSAVAVLIGSTIGSGIFRSPAGIADRLPGPLPFMLLWVAGGLYALCGALALAEVAGAYPATGGIYVYIREGWGRLWAFLFGWAEFALIRAASLGAISSTFAVYFLRVVRPELTPEARADQAHYVAAVAILVTMFFNYVGLRWGALVQNVTTLAKYGGLVLIIIAAFVLDPLAAGEQAVSFTRPLTEGPPAGSVGAFGLALISVLWVFDGWADLSFVGGEVKEPRRNVPRALILGVTAVIAIYLAANLAYLSVMSYAEVARSPEVAANLAGRLLGGTGVALVALIVMISTFGTLNGTLLTSPRIFLALATDGLFFKKVGAVHPRFRTPYVSIAMTALLGVVFVLVRTFEQLADLFVTAIVPFYALGVASIFVLRRRGDYDPPFRVPLYPVVPLVFIVGSIALIVNAIADPDQRWGTLAALGVIALGVPIYYMTVGRRPAPTPGWRIGETGGP
jgi:basic amino acid/polyamine antiporter, APA family